MLALPIFPASHPASIVGACELNFCVRDGNRWTLTAINTNSFRKAFAFLYVKALQLYQLINYSTQPASCQALFSSFP